VALLAGVAALAAAGGCSRLSVLDGRIDAIGDAEARRLIRDALWVGGSKYEWIKHDTIRAEVTRTDHAPLGDVVIDEVWLLGLWDGKVRMEVSAPLTTGGLSASAGATLAAGTIDPGEHPPSAAAGPRQVTVFDGKAWRTYVDGRESSDLDAKARAALSARLARELLVMPLALTEPDLRIRYAGTRAGPAEARLWERLLVTYAPEAGRAPGDRMVVEVLKATRQVDSVLIQWQDYPLVGRPLRVDMKLWEATDGLYTSRLWRFYPADEKAERTGPEQCTVRVRKVEFGAGAGAGDFEKP